MLLDVLNALIGSYITRAIRLSTCIFPVVRFFAHASDILTLAYNCSLGFFLGASPTLWFCVFLNVRTPPHLPNLAISLFVFLLKNQSHEACFGYSRFCGC